jgi:hypothetical protein
MGENLRETAHVDDGNQLPASLSLWDTATARDVCRAAQFRGHFRSQSLVPASYLGHFKSGASGR